MFSLFSKNIHKESMIAFRFIRVNEGQCLKFVNSNVDTNFVGGGEISNFVYWIFLNLHTKRCVGVRNVSSTCWDQKIKFIQNSSKICWMFLKSLRDQKFPSLNFFLNASSSLVLFYQKKFHNFTAYTCWLNMLLFVDGFGNVWKNKNFPSRDFLCQKKRMLQECRVG